MDGEKTLSHAGKFLWVILRWRIYFVKTKRGLKPHKNDKNIWYLKVCFLVNVQYEYKIHKNKNKYAMKL